MYFRRRYEAWLYNAAMRLFDREESMWYLANLEMPKIGLRHADRRRREREIRESNEVTRRTINAYFEDGITGMYD